MHSIENYSVAFTSLFEEPATFVPGAALMWPGVVWGKLLPAVMQPPARCSVKLLPDELWRMSPCCILLCGYGVVLRENLDGVSWGKPLAPGPRSVEDVRAAEAPLEHGPKTGTGKVTLLWLARSLRDGTITALW